MIDERIEPILPTILIIEDDLGLSQILAQSAVLNTANSRAIAMGADYETAQPKKEWQENFASFINRLEQLDEDVLQTVELVLADRSCLRSKHKETLAKILITILRLNPHALIAELTGDYSPFPTFPHSHCYVLKPISFSTSASNSVSELTQKLSEVGQPFPAIAANEAEEKRELQNEYHLDFINKQLKYLRVVEDNFREYFLPGLEAYQQYFRVEERKIFNALLNELKREAIDTARPTERARLIQDALLEIIHLVLKQVQKIIAAQESKSDLPLLLDYSIEARVFTRLRKNGILSTDLVSK